MADLELVEKLRERANVTYDEAREALDSCDDDLLDAVIYLERKGKVPPPNGGGSFNSKNERGEKPPYHSTYCKAEKTETFSGLVRRFFNWLGIILKKSCVNIFEVKHGDKVIISVPVLALVICLIGFFWATVPLLIVGIFFDCRYRLRGPETDNHSINTIIQEVESAADHFKNEVKNAQQSNQDKQ